MLLRKAVMEEAGPRTLKKVVFVKDMHGTKIGWTDRSFA